MTAQRNSARVMPLPYQDVPKSLSFARPPKYLSFRRWGGMLIYQHRRPRRGIIGSVYNDLPIQARNKPARLKRAPLFGGPYGFLQPIRRFTSAILPDADLR